MIITAELLKNKGFCNEGYNWLLEKYGDSFECEYEELYNALPYPIWKNWLNINFCRKPDVHRDYKGQFKIGDIVYVQSYDIGRWYKTKIYRIGLKEEGKYYYCKSGEGFYCMVDGPLPETERGINEEELFKTLDELKNFWIDKIRNLKDEKIKYL